MEKKKDLKATLDDKQAFCFEFIKYVTHFALFLGAGAGKTRLMIAHMFWVKLYVNPKCKFLIVTPKANAIDTWPTQLKQMARDHGVNLNMYVEHSEYTQQIIKPNVNCKYSADFIVVSYETLKRLGWHLNQSYFDYMVIDESHRIKSWKSGALSMVGVMAETCSRVYLLSGLPAPKDVADLYPQIFVLDGGERLGGNLSAFRSKHMQQSERNQHVWRPKGWPNIKKMERTRKNVLNKIRDLCITLETEQFVPDVTKANYHTINFELKPKELKRYKRFAKKHILAIAGTKFKAKSGPVLQNKLLQYISGNIYIDPDPDVKQRGPKKYKRTTKQRMKALDAHLKKTYKPGDKLIISWAFRHQVDDIMAVLRKHVKLNKIFVKNSTNSTVNLVRDWNNGRKDVIVSFASSVAEGLNLQEQGGSIIFYSLTYNYNHFYQLVRRIKRRGNPYDECDVYVISCEGTGDSEVSKNIIQKEEFGGKLMTTSQIITAVLNTVDG